ncbi:Concanavalin A-like lectin/glucanases superfamily protein [Pedobacter sp. ok626]|uniref:LamG-like jellyroll fold domain-containing protein n=1 Tax=Pedobacter sp. ok626 TaxID=1761882 RepID=UPI000880659E|nr:LamG-like jellyroll fold domain-containing protein [Pedobacter sp. ok626]SDJ38398.1 Concanavalin A-like lectin/glucanases superfamily protein [Pedobacter sp. ok626]
MIKNRLYKKRTLVSGMPLLVLCLLTLMSCNKDFENKIDLSAKSDSLTGYRAPKVLYIIVDGARGASVNATKAIRVPDLEDNSLQSYASVSDESGLPATTWADMLTGVKKNKHKVTKADFSGNNLANYPMFFKYIKDKNASLRTAAFASTPVFSTNLVSNADVNLSFNNDDAAVKNAVINELKEEKATVVLAEFSGVDRAGKQYGYDASVKAYSDAIYQTFDDINEMVNTLKQRKSYEAENWLIVVASNQGGNFSIPPAQNDGSLFSNPLLNSFTLLYNSRFSYQFFSRPNAAAVPYEGKAIVYSSKTIFGTIPVSESAIYNFGTTGEYTVQLKMKLLKRGDLNPAIIAKSDNTANSTAGWSFILSNGSVNWRMQLAGTSATGPALDLDTWYTLTGKLYMDGTTRRMKVFTNGVLNSTVAQAANGTSTTAPLNIGYSPSYTTGNDASKLITDVRIYNTALSDDYIAANYCKTDVKPTDVYYKNLIGYWPSMDGIGNQLMDHSPSKRNFTLTGAYSWTPFNELSENLCSDLPDDIYTRMPNGIDIPSFIFGWMGIQSLGLNLDGKTWVPTYRSINP